VNAGDGGSLGLTTDTNHWWWWWCWWQCSWWGGFTSDNGHGRYHMSRSLGWCHHHAARSPRQSGTYDRWLDPWPRWSWCDQRSHNWYAWCATTTDHHWSGGWCTDHSITRLTIGYLAWCSNINTSPGLPSATLPGVATLTHHHNRQMTHTISNLLN